MRISHLHAVALLAALSAIAGRPGTARAQEPAPKPEMIIQRTEMARSDRSSMQAAALDAVNRDMNDLFTAQRAYYAQHGVFAPDFAQLPGYPPRPVSGITMTAGDDWYVVLGGGPDIGVSQQIVYFQKPGSRQVAQGAGEVPIVRTERIEGTMTRPR